MKRILVLTSLAELLVKLIKFKKIKENIKNKIKIELIKNKIIILYK